MTVFDHRLTRPGAFNAAETTGAHRMPRQPGPDRTQGVLAAGVLTAGFLAVGALGWSRWDALQTPPSTPTAPVVQPSDTRAAPVAESGCTFNGQPCGEAVPAVLVGRSPTSLAVSVAMAAVGQVAP